MRYRAQSARHQYGIKKIFPTSMYLFQVFDTLHMAYPPIIFSAIAKINVIQLSSSEPPPSYSRNYPAIPNPRLETPKPEQPLTEACNPTRPIDRHLRDHNLLQNNTPCQTRPLTTPASQKRPQNGTRISNTWKVHKKPLKLYRAMSLPLRMGLIKVCL
jgi:hypothetical protein